MKGTTETRRRFIPKWTVRDSLRRCYFNGCLDPAAPERHYCHDHLEYVRQFSSGSHGIAMPDSYVAPPSSPRPEWMDDPSLLPKKPPRAA